MKYSCQRALQRGESHRHIKAETGVSYDTITSIRKTLRYVPPPKPPGRHPITSARNDRHLVQTIRGGEVPTATQLSRESERIVAARRRLKAAGLKARKKVKKPLLTPRHSANRRAWANEFKCWSWKKWTQVVWSDETKVNRFGSDGVRYVWVDEREGPLPKRLIEPTVKHDGGNVMVWGCFSWEGVGKVHFFENRLNAQGYLNILKGPLMESARMHSWKWGNKPGQKIFQQDLDPKHTSKLAKNFLAEKKIPTLPWTSQSPDMSPIEHLWIALKNRLYSRYPLQPRNLEELKGRIEGCWGEITLEECRKLILSMPDRVSALRKAKRGNTKY